MIVKLNLDVIRNLNLLDCFKAGNVLAVKIVAIVQNMIVLNVIFTCKS